jgi:iron complex transport system substrate-binding protein
MVRMMRLFGLLLFFFVSACLPALAQERPQRIVSLNMCTDQLALALADPDQIVGLSRFAGDERLSLCRR